MAFQSIPEGQQEETTIHIIDDDEQLLTAHNQSGGSSGGYVRKGLPITILGGGRTGGDEAMAMAPTLSLAEALANMVGLQEILGQEERLCYLRAAGVGRREDDKQGAGGHLRAAFHSGVYGKVLGCLAADSAQPLLNTCEAMLECAKRRRGELERLTQRLENKLAAKTGHEAVGQAMDEGADDGGRVARLLLSETSRGEVLRRAAEGGSMAVLPGSKGEGLAQGTTRHFSVGREGGVWGLLCDQIWLGRLSNISRIANGIEVVVDGGQIRLKLECEESVGQLWTQQVWPTIAPVY